jgi:hypothetical protein
MLNTRVSWTILDMINGWLWMKSFLACASHGGCGCPLQLMLYLVCRHLMCLVLLSAWSVRGM